MPRIDPRNFQMLLDERKSIVPYYTPEWDITDEKDAGVGLLKIFTYMQEEIIKRLNRVPEKNFIAFLEMLGINLIPAQPARTPVIFHLTEGMPGGIFVPQRTQVATEETGEHKALVFETVKGFYACSASIEEIYCADPERDEIFRYEADGKKEFRIFTGEKNLQEHILYLGHKDFFNLKEEANIRLKFKLLLNPNSLKNLTWEYWGKKESPETFDSTTTWYDAPRKEYSVVLATKGEIKEKEINGIKSRWILCRFIKANDDDLPVISGIKIVDVATVNPVKPDSGFHNSIPLDLMADFYPFGAQPRLFDTFYMASKEAFTKKNADITIMFKKKRDTVVVANNVEFSWEYWNGTIWRPLEGIDKTIDFQKDETITFICPEDLTELEVNGEKNYWIRVRLINGNYGKDEFSAASANGKEFWYIEPKFNPPLISEIGINYSFGRAGIDLQYCLTKNNLEYRDFTKENKQDVAFRPFRLLSGNKPVLYMGFDDAFKKGNISIYFSLFEKVYPPDSRPKIEWTYWSSAPNLIGNMTDLKEADLVSTEGISTGTELLFEESVGNNILADTAIIASFRDKRIELEQVLNNRYTQAAGIFKRTYLEVSDSTEYLTKSGMLELIAPPLQFKTNRFGKESYWLMGALTRSEKVYEPPLIRGIYPNTVWAEEIETIEDEILGSSDGDKNQNYKFIRSPVISPEIWVMEGEIIPQDEKETLSGSDINKIKDSTGKNIETWVIWRAVDDLIDSGTRSRHCIIDNSMGIVQFGDGEHGMIPPIGKDNIKANYQSGGGVKGNVAKNEISVLKTPIAGIGRVNNPEPAEGGYDTEPLEEVLERGSHLIKHRERAVTKEDFERIAGEASSYIARTKCFTDGNKLKIIIIPEGKEDRPIPSYGIKRIVEKRLIECSLNLILVESIEVIDPIYKEVKVTAEVIPESIDRAVPLEKEIMAQLKEYLHPLTGGNENSGWEFGRGVHISDIYALLEDINGVDHVENLKLNGVPADVEITESETACSGEHRITMKLGGRQ